MILNRQKRCIKCSMYFMDDGGVNRCRITGKRMRKTRQCKNLESFEEFIITNGRIRSLRKERGVRRLTEIQKGGDHGTATKSKSITESSKDAIVQRSEPREGSAEQATVIKPVQEEKGDTPETVEATVHKAGRCNGITAAGVKCKRKPMKESQLCGLHQEQKGVIFDFRL